MRCGAARDRGRRRRFPRALPGTDAVRDPGGFPEGHPFRNIRAMPAGRPLPPIFLLGSSGLQRAACRRDRRGVFVRASFFRSSMPVAGDAHYRDNFKPSQSRAKPYAILGVAAVCADTDEEADRLATTVDLNFVRRGKGEYLPLASPEEALRLPVHAGRPRAHPAQPGARCSSARRRRSGEARAAGRSDRGRRSDGHHDDLRSCGAQALLRAAGGGVRMR